MIRTTSFIDLVPGTSPTETDQLLDALRTAAAESTATLAFDAARTVPSARPGGDLMLMAAYADEAARHAAHQNPYADQVLLPLIKRHVAHMETTTYRQGPVVVRDPTLGDGIQRTLLLRVDPATDPEQVLQFERILADMPRYIDAIRNSSLSRVDDVARPRRNVWTHVWEQEYTTLEGLTGPYMTHPYHWSYVDTWFDPQSPNHIVDTTLIHAACALRTSILAKAPDIRPEPAPPSPTPGP